jgi:hypothetical protein
MMVGLPAKGERKGKPVDIIQAADSSDLFTNFRYPEDPSERRNSSRRREFG